MHLHENAELFADALLATAQQKGLRELYVEKDYWVTLALYTLFSGDMGKEVVFKGGTALSKCFGLIERFSEDIDLALIRKDGETDSAMSAKNKKVSALVSGVLPEIPLEGVTHKRGKNRKTAHQYARNAAGEWGQVRAHIIVESTWLGYFEPNEPARVSCYIAEMMQQNGQQELIASYGLEPFAVQVLSLERTLCEKIMSLVRFSFTSTPLVDLANKIRHAYDVHQLLSHEALQWFFESEAFEEMLIKVGQDDVESYRNNNGWLFQHPASALVFAQTEATWKQLRTTYHTDFKGLVFGNFPPEEAIVQTLLRVAGRLNSLRWPLEREG